MQTCSKTFFTSEFIEPWINNERERGKKKQILNLVSQFKLNHRSSIQRLESICVSCAPLMLSGLLHAIYIKRLFLYFSHDVNRLCFTKRRDAIGLSWEMVQTGCCVPCFTISVRLWLVYIVRHRLRSFVDC
jgi:hypothetical protein